MDPLSSILGPVCERLLDAAIEEYRLVRGVKEEIRNLRTTVVPMIKGVLEDAERKKDDSRAIREWLKSLKQILFDAEDVFDEIATEEALERDAKDGTTQSAVITRRLSKVLKLKSYTLLPPSTSALVNLRQLITATVVVPKMIISPKKIISLETLEAKSCSPKQIATWLRQVSSLQELYIEKCPQLRCFGAGDDDDTTINAGDLDLEGALLDLAPSLRELRLWDCENLSSLPSKLRSLTRLETLRINYCPKIQRLPSAGLPQTLKRLFFPRLRTLLLSSCEKLRELPPLPPTLTELSLYHVGLTRLPGWILEGCSEDDIGRDDVVMMPASTSTSSSSPSRMLSTLYISDCPNITSLDDGDGLLQRPLRMLKKLTIKDCGELRSLLVGAADGLVSLEELEVTDCPKLVSWRVPSAATEEDAQRQQQKLKQHPLFLPRLRTLRLECCEKLRELPPLPPTLTELRLVRVGVRSPKWMGDPSWVSTSLLVKVELRDCRKWEVLLPPLGQLPCLEVLNISRMPGVRRIGPEFFFSCCCDDGEGGVKLAPGFPSLEELKFRDMPEWEEWESPVELLEQQQHQHPLLFPRLRTLCLENCEKLRELPPLPPTLTTLSLWGVGLTRLPGWMERCSLSTLKINDCPNITSLDDGLRSLLGGAAGRLVSLEKLTIQNCPKLLHLVEEGGGAAAAAVMSSSTVVVVPKKIISLKTLRAVFCSPKQIATWLRQVSSLQELEIWICPQLRCFGAGDDDDTTINGGDLDLEGALLDLAPSLRELRLWDCENLSSLPSKLRSLARLETLVIWNCPKIQRLPSAGLPESLKKLVIDGCPELAPRCREEGCPDWPLLSHIPDVEIGD